MSDELSKFKDIIKEKYYIKWIPVTERLPEIKNNWEIGIGVRKLVTIQKNYQTYTREATFKNNHWVIEFGRDITKHVTAWAELPYPYIEI